MLKRRVPWVCLAILLGPSAIGCGEEPLPEEAEEEEDIGVASSPLATCISGMGTCGTYTGHSLWGIKAFSNGPANGTGYPCTDDGSKRYMCTDYVERFFDRMGSAYNVSFTYTGNECANYAANPNFSVSYNAATSVKQGDAIVWRDSGGGHTAIVVSESSSGVISFIQQNVICSSTSVIAPRDTVTRVNGNIPSYNHPFKCRIRAVGACPTVGAYSYDSTGCLLRECLSTHVWGSWQNICHGK